MNNMNKRKKRESNNIQIELITKERKNKIIL